MDDRLKDLWTVEFNVNDTIDSPYACHIDTLKQRLLKNADYVLKEIETDNWVLVSIQPSHLEAHEFADDFIKKYKALNKH